MTRFERLWVVLFVVGTVSVPIWFAIRWNGIPNHERLPLLLVDYVLMPTLGLIAAIGWLTFSWNAGEWLVDRRNRHIQDQCWRRSQ